MQENFKIKVKYLTDIDHLEQLDVGDAIDVRAAEDVDLLFMQSAKIHLGFCCKLPDGYFAFLSPRSSTFDKYGIIQTNSPGVIDSSFCGDNDEWCMPVIALRTNVHIPKNTRIGQFTIIKKIPNDSKIEFETVQSLNNKDRGSFGSTGEN